MQQEKEDILAVAIVGLDKAQEAAIRDRFSEFTEITNEWAEKAFAIVVSDENDEKQMRQAREGRLLLRARRTDLEKKRVTLKDRSLSEGRAIDAAARILKGLIEPIEAHLLEQETFGARAKEASEKLLVMGRTEKLAQFGVNTTLYNLGTMSQADFTQLYEDSAILAHTKAEEAKWAAKKAADEAAEAEAEKARADEVARAERERERAELAEKKLENERLEAAVQAAEDEKKQAADKAAVAIKKVADEARAKQKRAADLLAKQVEETKRAQAEAQHQKDEVARIAQAAGDKAKADADAKAETARRAAAAPDRDKLLAFAEKIAAIIAPALIDTEAAAYAEQALDLMAKVAADLRANAAKM